MNEIRLRIHGSPALPTLIYLPGLHGDWTLVSSFRHEITGKVRFVEITYPHTTTWTLDDYAREIESALAAEGVREGWIIGESFGSQPAWAMIAREQRGESRLNIHGLILAGGFVKHPWPLGAKFLRLVNQTMPRAGKRLFLKGYATYAKFRHRQAPDTLANVAEFVANRLHPDDSPAIYRRFTLIIESDVAPTARACKLPIFQLAGIADPIVPVPLIRRWLKRNCPGFRESVTLYAADHNVLGTAPQKSVEYVLKWMGTTAGRPA